MTRVSATFTVYGGTAEDFDIDTEGLTPGAMAARVDREFGGVRLCRQCASSCEDPQAELNGFIVNGVEYVLSDETGEWVSSDQEFRA